MFTLNSEIYHTSETNNICGKSITHQRLQMALSIDIVYLTKKHKSHDKEVERTYYTTLVNYVLLSINGVCRSILVFY